MKTMSTETERHREQALRNMGRWQQHQRKLRQRSVETMHTSHLKTLLRIVEQCRQV
jgi:hypothetical protein